MLTRAAAGLLGAWMAVSVAQADDAAAPPTGDQTWAARAQLGYSKTGGNTDNSAGNFLFHAAHLMGDWKLLFATDGHYGATRGETTAQAWDAALQANYNITPKLYWYVGLSHIDDRFSGFAYQEAVKSGAGYQFIQTDATRLSAQVGVGYRRLRPEILVKDEVGGIISRTELDAESDAVLDGGFTFEHAFNEATKLLASANVEAGQQNTLTTAAITLQVKMTHTLALAAGYQISDNSKPPAGSGRRDSLTTLNLVWQLPNEKLKSE